MLEYAFESITPEQALAIQAGDTLTFNTGSANAVRVIYDPEGPSFAPGQILVTLDERTVAFGTGLSAVSKAGGLVFGDGSQLHVGDGGNDRFVGGAADDGAFGGLGDDTLIGGAGRDFLQGNTGDDVIVGGDGADTLFGGQGDDVLYASSDAGGRAGEAGDFVQGNKGDDHIFGGGGGDTLLGGQGDDTIEGSDGDDWLSGDLGDDELHGGMGSDTLIGGAGNDTLDGGFGLDFLSGGDGNDRLVAQGPEIVVLSGDAGNDTLTAASADKDILLGGSGQDRFEIVAKVDPAIRVDAEIQDFEAHDTLHFSEVSIFGDAQASILPRGYSEFVADSYEQALAIANEHISATGAKYVAAQVGANVFVFADLDDPEDGADSAVLLVGRTLDDISLANFV